MKTVTKRRVTGLLATAEKEKWDAATWAKRLGLPMRDLTENLDVVVSPEDFRVGVPLSPTSCAGAHCLNRYPDVLAASVLPTVTALVYPHEVVRGMTRASGKAVVAANDTGKKKPRQKVVWTIGRVPKSGTATGQREYRADVEAGVKGRPADQPKRAYRKGARTTLVGIRSANA